MDHKEAMKQTPSSLLPNSTIVDSPTKQPNISCGGGGGGDRLKRDEWSEGAVSTLLEAYEAKWVLRNRAKLKGHDWEDIAKYVSCRANSTKTPKTQTQCKNKIESMKKRYRSESATADPSSWPLFPRLDLLLRGSTPPPPQPPPPPPPAAVLPPPPPPPLMLIQPLSQSPPAQPLRPPPEAAVPISVASPSTLSPAPPPPQLHLGVAQICHASNGFDRITKEDGMNTKMSDHLSDKNDTETDSSTPNLYSTDKEKLKSKNNEKRNRKRPRRRRGDEESEIAESIRWLAEVVAKSEKARVDTMREMEKMRAESEVKRSEMDLKRTEIVANTQLEIARLFAGTGKGAVDPSLRIGRS